ncbi:hypothetical protein PVAP13_1KG187600 [Panicum virgatum]|uniref:Meg domain-containing protein n=1 Tax=Panicum virgatum TaxID=38727 RepID=A0A8T0XIZ8_PANVG|nr:hypothetical protein PVAP13_1KG187600 [Panicum virgatum]
MEKHMNALVLLPLLLLGCFAPLTTNQVMKEMGTVKTSHIQGCFRARHPKCTSNLCWCCHGDVHTCGSTLQDCQAQCSRKMNYL